MGIYSLHPSGQHSAGDQQFDFLFCVPTSLTKTVPQIKTGIMTGGRIWVTSQDFCFLISFVLGGSSHYSKWVKTPVINGYKWDTYCLQIAAGKFESLRRGPSWETVIVQGLQNLPCWLGLCKRPEVKAGWWEDIDLMTPIWYAFTEWQLMILGYNWIIKAFSASFRIIFCIISENLTTSNCGPNFGSNFGKAKAIDRDRSALDILDLLLEVPWWLCHGHGCHGFDRDAKTMPRSLPRWTPGHCWTPGLRGRPGRIRRGAVLSVLSAFFSEMFDVIYSFVLCHSMDILYILSMQCAKEWRKVCQRWYLAAVKSSVRKIPRSSQFREAPAQFFFFQRTAAKFNF